MNARSDSLMYHRIARWIFALAVGLLSAYLAFQWATNTVPRAERELQETAVMASREQLLVKLGLERIEIVDPLEPDRTVGKTYIYPAAGGWEVSGYYRRDKTDAWHPYLVTLDGGFALTHVKVADKRLMPLADGDQAIEVLP